MSQTPPFDKKGNKVIAEMAVKDLLGYIGEDVNRPGLLETPHRVVKAYDEWFAGYGQDPAKVLKTFEDGAELCGDEMVLVDDIQFYSYCEHHMAPFFGTAHIAYVPKNRIVGLSKFPRLVDIFSKRLQVQERLTNQIANAIQENLDPHGVGVVMRAQHFCMCSRGVNKQGSTTLTSALRGCFKDNPETRKEFFSFIGQAK